PPQFTHERISRRLGKFPQPPGNHTPTFKRPGHPCALIDCNLTRSSHGKDWIRPCTVSLAALRPSSRFPPPVLLSRPSPRVPLRRPKTRRTNRSISRRK